MWFEDGGLVFNDLENRNVVFLCAQCHAEGERYSQLLNKKVPVPLRG